MSAERFFDDVARTLAEPMPRRRAVRVLGVSLAALAVPALRPRPAGAEVGACVKTTCGKDQRCCQKFTDAGMETYCCPRPSWQFQCGSTSNGYRCINTCKPGGKNFACTALIEHPESGINGVCCDRRLHSGCVRSGPPAERGVPSQAWKPSCCPKGPGFGFCNGTCCEAPNKCIGGICRCPNGTFSCDGRNCCKRRQTCSFCAQTSTLVPVSPSESGSDFVGKKCCPESTSYCCGTTCCKKPGCCGTKCCPEPALCAKAGGQKVCCPPARVTEVGGHYACCPAGTVRIDGNGGCCPPSRRDCCGGFGTPPVSCGTMICVRGACVNP